MVVLLLKKKIFIHYIQQMKEGLQKVLKQRNNEQCEVWWQKKKKITFCQIRRNFTSWDFQKKQKIPIGFQS